MRGRLLPPIRRGGDSGALPDRPPGASAGGVGGVRGPVLASGALLVLLLAACGGHAAPAGTRAADPQRGGAMTVLVPRGDSAPPPQRGDPGAEAMVRTAVFRQLYAPRPADRGEARTPDAVTDTDAPVPDL